MLCELNVLRTGKKCTLDGWAFDRACGQSYLVYSCKEVGILYLGNMVVKEVDILYLGYGANVQCNKLFQLNEERDGAAPKSPRIK